MKECDFIQQLISGMVDEELDRSDRAAVAEHIASCPECKALYDAFALVSAAVADDIQELPKGLHENIMAGVHRSAIVRKNKAQSGMAMSRRTRNVLAAAACFAVVLLSAFGIAGKLSSRHTEVRDAAEIQHTDSAAAMPAAAAEEQGEEASTEIAVATETPTVSTTPAVKNLPQGRVVPTDPPVDPNRAPDPYSGNSAVLAPTPTPKRTPMPTRTPVPTRTPAPTPETETETVYFAPPRKTEAPKQTEVTAPVQKTEPAQEQTAMATPAEAAVPPVAENDKAESEAPAPQTETAAQSESKTEAAAETAPAATTQPARTQMKMFAARPQTAEPDAGAESVQVIEDTQPDVAAPETDESEAAAAPAESAKPEGAVLGRILKAIFDSSRENENEAQPSASPSPTAEAGAELKKIEKPHVDVVADLRNEETYEQLSALLLGKLSELPKGKPDRTYLLQLKVGDMDVELLVHVYGDKLYYTIYDPVVKQSVYLADCTQKELDDFIREFVAQPEASPSVTPSSTPEAEAQALTESLPETAERD